MNTLMYLCECVHTCEVCVCEQDVPGRVLSKTQEAAWRELFLLLTSEEAGPAPPSHVTSARVGECGRRVCVVWFVCVCVRCVLCVCSLCVYFES